MPLWYIFLFAFSLFSPPPSPYFPLLNPFSFHFLPFKFLFWCFLRSLFFFISFTLFIPCHVLLSTFLSSLIIVFFIYHYWDDFPKWTFWLFCTWYHIYKHNLTSSLEPFYVTVTSIIPFPSFHFDFDIIITWDNNCA